MKANLPWIAGVTAVALIFSSLVIGAETSKPKPYSLTNCLVSDEKLGSMGKPVRIVHQGQEVKFCCKPCVRKFKKDPETYLAKLNN